MAWLEFELAYFEDKVKYLRELLHRQNSLKRGKAPPQKELGIYKIITFQ